MARTSGVYGLCAFAVLAVVVFAVDPTWLRGGFAGVDVLFVVAGYVAARWILEAKADGRFSLAAFYGRLLRRTVPATLAMLAAVSAVVWATWPAHGVADYSLTLAASAVFAANLVFAEITGYFGPFAGAHPLLHLWALGLAVQVLLVLPLLYMLIVRLAPGRLQLILMVLTVVSYWAGIWGSGVAPERAWYMPHMRAWEVLFGVLVVFGELPELTSRVRRAAIALLGLAIVGGSFVMLDSGVAYPGVATIAPTLGAALVIFAGAGGSNPVSAALDFRPLAVVGAAALSVYLWHWPALVVARSLSPGDATLVGALVGALAAAAVAAALSHRFLERPFRGPSVPAEPRSVALMVLGMAVLFGVAAFGVMA